MWSNRHFTNAPTLFWSTLIVASLFTLAVSAQDPVAGIQQSSASASASATSSLTSLVASSASSSSSHRSSATASVHSTAYIVIPPLTRYGVPQTIAPPVFFETSEADDVRHEKEQTSEEVGKDSSSRQLSSKFQTASTSSKYDEKNVAETRTSDHSSSTASASKQRYFPRQRGISPYGRKVSRLIVAKSQQYNSAEEKAYAKQHTARYAFEWNVADAQHQEDEHEVQQSGNDLYSHKEGREGSNTTGEYRVRLPDGRLQIVTYDADENGYRAKVSYVLEDEESHRASHNSFSTSQHQSGRANVIRNQSASTATSRQTAANSGHSNAIDSNRIAESETSGTARRRYSSYSQRQASTMGTSSVKKGQQRLPASFGIRGYYLKNADSAKAASTSSQQQNDEYQQQKQQVFQRSTNKKVDQQQTSKDIVQQKTRNYANTGRQQQSATPQQLSNSSNVLDLGYAKVVVSTQASILLNHNHYHEQGHQAYASTTVSPVAPPSGQQNVPGMSVLIASKGEKSHIYGQQPQHYQQQQTEHQGHQQSHYLVEQNHRQHQSDHREDNQNNLRYDFVPESQPATHYIPAATPAKPSKSPSRRFSKTLSSYGTYGINTPGVEFEDEGSEEETKILIQNEQAQLQRFPQENSQTNVYGQQARPETLSRARGGTRSFFFRANSEDSVGHRNQETHHVNIVKRDEKEGQSQESREQVTLNAHGHQESNLSFFKAEKQQKVNYNTASSQQNYDQTNKFQLKSDHYGTASRTYTPEPLAVMSLPSAHRMSPRRLAEFTRDVNNLNRGSDEDATRRTVSSGSGPIYRSNVNQAGYSGYVAPTYPVRRVNQYTAALHPPHSALYRGAVRHTRPQPYQGQPLSTMTTAAKYSTGRYGHNYSASLCPSCQRMAAVRRPSISAKYTPNIVRGGSFSRIVGGRPVIYVTSIDAGRYGTVQNNHAEYGTSTNNAGGNSQYRVKSQQYVPRRAVATANVNYSPQQTTGRLYGYHANGHHHAPLRGLSANSRAEVNGYGSVSAQASASVSGNLGTAVASANAEINSSDDDW